MQTVMTARELACWQNRTDKPTVAEVNGITAQCRDGRIKHATKINRTWHINCTKEWPELFPEEADPQPNPAAEAIGDMLIELGRMLKGGSHGKAE